MYLRALAMTAVAAAVLLVGSTPATASAAPLSAPRSIPGCADSDFSCGYLHGFADGRTAKNNGLCGHHRHGRATLAPSEQGYGRAFEHFCPA